MRLPLVPDPYWSSASLPACDDVGVEGHAHVIVGAEQDRIACPAITASVGDFTCSITIANGSVTPVSISAWRSAMIGSNFDIRSRSGATFNRIGEQLFGY